MMIRVNKAHFPVTVLGPGRRLGIWMQGCSVGCRNCVSQDTWADDSGREISVDLLLSWARSVTRDLLDGVTISGGEPFDQPVALNTLLDGLVAWRDDVGLEFDILCYSGRTQRFLQANHAPLLAKLDALIPEPFLADRVPGKIWRGSDNQSLIPQSPLGHRIYAPYVDQPAESSFQTVTAGGRVWFIGIPGSGGMEPVEDACARHGLKLKESSWQ